MIEKQPVSDTLAKFIRRNLERYSPSFWSVENKHHLNILPKLNPSDLVYICPLCRVHYIFQKDDELFWSTEFTKDHFPPNSVGGKNNALVCKSCNNKLGSTIESHLPSGLRARYFFEHKGSMPIALSVNKRGNYKLNGSLEGGKLSLKENNRKSNLLQLIKEAAEKMMAEKEPFVMNLKGVFPNEQLVAKALLKAAFLQFFTWAGCDFTFSATAGKIREVLNGKISHPLENQGVFSRITGANLTDGIYALITEGFPKSFFCHLTYVEPQSGQPVHNVVLIPINTSKAWTEQIQFNQFLQNTYIDWTFLKYPNSFFESSQPFPYSSETIRLRDL